MISQGLDILIIAGCFVSIALMGWNHDFSALPILGMIAFVGLAVPRILDAEQHLHDLIESIKKDINELDKPKTDKR